ncbi:hypothetical protein RND81_07G126100 [Saponaria officinalis]|uniref:Uncharacterized protein n=1 Tax=Saponaria officinalis TaxID=3572 RepID=A0AAW1JMT6_SAPOF
MKTTRDNNPTTAAASSPLRPKPVKFAVYQNPALSAALTATSLRPSPPSFLLLFSLFSASSASLLFFFSSKENHIVDMFKVGDASEELAYLLLKLARLVVGLVFIGATIAIVKVIASKRIKNNGGTKTDTSLSSRQLRLLGLELKPNNVVSETPRKPPVSKSHAPLNSTDPLVPLHQLTSPSRSSLGRSDSSNSNVARSKSFGVPSKSLTSSASFVGSPTSSRMSSVMTSPGKDQFVATPWSKERGSPAKELVTEDELEGYLAYVDKRITESAEKLATPPPMRNGFSISSPSTISGATSMSGTTRTTPLRPVRMSPSSQKYTTPPKKGEGEIPSPMSMEESIEAFKHLGIYPQIEEWRDHLRQWFSSVLLSPLLSKIEHSHTKVMNAAAKLGVSVTVSPVGSDSTSGAAPTVSSVDCTKEWQPTFTPDEDSLLNQLRASVVQSLDASMYRLNSANQQQNQQQNAFLPIMQECVDAITEHQRLLSLMKGELIKGLLPQSSIPAEYTAHRIKELAEGTCVKNYEYMLKEEASDKLKKKWTLELPTDSHLLLYLFCAFLEYPKWMLHVDPSSYSGAQSSKNPLFLGVLPPKERFPEKYVAVISSVPSIVHPGATVLVIEKVRPPTFVMYWDKKRHFCLQGRTALWDSVLVLCHRVKTTYSGFIRGIHLGSRALSLMPVLELEEEEE